MNKKKKRVRNDKTLIFNQSANIKPKETIPSNRMTRWFRSF